MEYTIIEVELDIMTDKNWMQCNDYDDIKCNWTYQAIGCLSACLGIRSKDSSEQKVDKNKDKIEIWKNTTYWFCD